jgi:hypothetical protein
VAIATALVRTCCKLVANLLTPVNAGAAVREASGENGDDVDEDAIFQNRTSRNRTGFRLVTSL